MAVPLHSLLLVPLSLVLYRIELVPSLNAATNWLIEETLRRKALLCLMVLEGFSPQSLSSVFLGQKATHGCQEVVGRREKRREEKREV